jgi:hypothetical protein
MNERTIQTRSLRVSDCHPRRRKPSLHPAPSAAIKKIAGRVEAVRQKLAASFEITDRATELIEVTGEFPKIR